MVALMDILVEIWLKYGLFDDLDESLIKGKKMDLQMT